MEGGGNILAGMPLMRAGTATVYGDQGGKCQQ